MNDPHSKRCTDYLMVGIVISGSSDPPHGFFTWHVDRDGRRLFSNIRHAECSMFAEELYERIQLARAAQERREEG